MPVSMHHIPLEVPQRLLFTFTCPLLGFRCIVINKFISLQIVIRNRMPIDLTNFDYTKKKRWQFQVRVSTIYYVEFQLQDAVYSIEFIKALPVYHLMDYCSKVITIPCALLPLNHFLSFDMPTSSNVSEDSRSENADRVRIHVCLLYSSILLIR